MCGRFTLQHSGNVIAQRFGLSSAPFWEARFNLAPTQSVLVVRLSQASRVCSLLRWGLIPSWANDPAIGSRLVNARAETVADKPAFRTAFQKRRCLVPADGFYEWRTDRGKKQPHLFSLSDNGLFAFAGLWEAKREGEQILETVSILTTEANEVVRPVHDRMPVILPREAEALWLDPGRNEPGQLQELLRPYPGASMTSRPVSTVVNSARNEGPACVEPAGPLQRSLF